MMNDARSGRKTTGGWWWLWSPGAFIFLGIIILGVGIYELISVSSFLPGTLSADGALNHARCVPSNLDKRYHCTLTILFTAQSGKHVTFVTNTTEPNPPKYYKGQRMPVQYKTANPTDARLYATSDTLWIDQVAAGVGAVLLIAGLIWMVIKKMRA